MAGWCNPGPERAPCSRPAHSWMRRTQSAALDLGLVCRQRCVPTPPGSGLNPDSAPHIRAPHLPARQGGIRGPGAHLISSSLMSMNAGTLMVKARHRGRCAPKPRRPETELPAAAPHNRFRVTHRGSGKGSSTGRKPRRPIPARILTGAGQRGARHAQGVSFQDASSPSNRSRVAAAFVAPELTLCFEVL